MKLHFIEYFVYGLVLAPIVYGLYKIIAESVRAILRNRRKES